MHREANLVGLEQRRYIQLLCLMCAYKNFGNVERIFARNTRRDVGSTFELILIKVANTKIVHILKELYYGIAYLKML